MALPAFYMVILALHHPKWHWRSSASISKESGADRHDVEIALEALMDSGQVVRNPMNEDQWGLKWRVKDSAIVVQHDRTPYCKCCGRPMPVESADTPDKPEAHL